MREREGERGGYEVSDDALVNQDREGDAKDANEGEVAASPAEVVLEIFSDGSPLLYELVLVCFHSSPHSLLLTALCSALSLSFQHCLSALSIVVSNLPQLSTRASPARAMAQLQPNPMPKWRQPIRAFGLRGACGRAQAQVSNA